MDLLGVRRFQLGDWCVDTGACQISRDAEVISLDVRAMRLLQSLAARAGEVVSIDELLDEAWAGVVVSPDSVYQAVTTLRRALGDQSRQPRYIATVPRLGYRLVAPVQALPEAPGADLPTPRSTPPEALPGGQTTLPAASPDAASPSRRRSGLWLAGMLLAAALGLLLLRPAWRTPGSGTESSAVRAVAVLPFADLTEQMDEEPFADGMTEQLINTLGKLPGVRVPSRTSSFLYKDKKASIAEIGQALGCAYVLEGSVRKSGGTLRVTARLVRAADGWLVWTESYDRPVSDILAIQDDIAAEVRRALENAWRQEAPGSAAR